jgi:hypothetical protein
VVSDGGRPGVGSDARCGPGGLRAAGVDVLDDRAGASHQTAEDPGDLRELERPLDERDEGAERNDEQNEPEDHRCCRDEVVAGAVGVAADRREREERVGRRGRVERQAGDHHGVATQPRGEPWRVRRRLDLRGDEHRREHDAGERDHAGGERAEDLLRGSGGDR